MCNMLPAPPLDTIARVERKRRVPAIGVALSMWLCVGCGSDPTDPSVQPGRVVFTAAQQRRLLVVDPDALQENDTGFQPAERTIEVGSWPWDVTFSQDGDVVFVAQRRGDNVKLFSSHDGRMLDSVGVGFSPVHLILSVDGRTLYVASTGAGTIAVLDVSAHVNGRTAGIGAVPVVQTIELESVGWLAETTDGMTLVATMPDHDALAVIDTDDGTVRGVIPTGDAPQSVVIGPDDRTAYVPSFVSARVTVVDIVDGVVDREIFLGSGGVGAVGVALSEAGYLYVARWSAASDSDRGVLAKVDPVTGNTVAEIEVGPQPYDVEISPDGKLAVVSSFLGVVAAVDLERDVAVLAEVGAALMGGLAFTPLR